MDEHRSLRLIDPTDGSTHWHLAVDVGVDTFGPDPEIIDGIVVLADHDAASPQRDVVVGFDPATGRELWRHLISATALTSVADTAIVRTGAELVAIEPQQGQIMWRRAADTASRFEVPIPVRDGLWATVDGRLVQLSTASGEITRTLSGGDGDIVGATAAPDGASIVVAPRDGPLQLFDARPGTQRWSVELPTGWVAGATPVASDDIVVAPIRNTDESAAQALIAVDRFAALDRAT